MINANRLFELKWIGFDLDDTLHFYRKASGAASEEVYKYLEDEFGTDAGQLRSAYREILKDAQSGCFAEGKTSRDYRAERFSRLLARFSIIPQLQLDVVLDLYDVTLSKNLKLKEGALQILQAAKSAGLQIMVVTEGPHDAQETTLQRLELTPYVDLLVTSSREQTSKTEGLLGIALQKAACAPGEILYVGDSLESDILPAQKLGVRCLYVGEAESLPDGVTRLASLLELQPQLERLQSPRNDGMA
jgi:putative hydrolase of the HAD superfamily